MSELKAGVIVTPHDEGMCFNRGSDVIAVTERETEFYLKSEADVVLKDQEELIAKKDKEIAELNNYADEVNKDFELVDNQNEYLLKIVRHNKYKRCLAMAAVCFEKSYSTTLVKYDKESGLLRNFYDWWGNCWLALAEEPTWTKFLQLIHKEAK